MRVLWGGLALGAGMLGAAPGQQWPTLAEVLQQHGVPVTAVASQDLERRVTSFATTDDGPGVEQETRAPRTTSFTLAYYEADSNKTLQAPLHVLRYRPGRGQVELANLGVVSGPGVATEAGFRVGGEALSAVSGQLSVDCLGAVLSMKQGPGWTAIETHVNPSAACLLVLGEDLQFRYFVSGFPVGTVAGGLLVEGNTIHFAPTHPLVLGVLDPARATLHIVYPRRGDPGDRYFSDRLRKALRGHEAECGRDNLPCEPKAFETELGGVVETRLPNGCFRFRVTKSADGFPKAVQEAVQDETAVYRSCPAAGRWRTRAEAAPR